MKIEISQNDFGTICVCALRYCMGRRTYMPRMVQDIVLEHFDDLSDRDLEVLANDETFQYRMGLWGDTCDKEDWLRFWTKLKEKRSERHDKEGSDS